MTEIPLTGSLQSTGLPQLLAYLNKQRKIGILIIKTLAFTKKVYFQQGDAIFASSTYEEDRLGEMMIKAGKITLEQFDKASEVLRETRKRLGAILVELGYITPKDLFWGVKFQVKEIICSLFQLEEAEYEFIEEELPTSEVITLKMSMGNLIYEGVKRIDNWTRIRNEMPGTESILKLSNDPAALFQDVELSPQDRKMLSLVDGRKTIKELIDSAWIGSFEALKTLHVLWTIGVIEEKTKAQEIITEQGKEHAETFSLEEILQPVEEDEEEFIRKVDRIFLNIENINEHELLDVDEDADMETITKNYYRLTREYHPDRFYGTADPSLKDKLTLIFDKLSRAYTYLKEMHEKKQSIPVQAEKKEPLLKGNGSEHFKKGVEAFRNGNFSAAIDAFRAATETDPKNAKYWSHLSLAFSRIKTGFNDAEKASLEAMNLEPGNADHSINLGMIYMKKGMKEKALEQFEHALSIDSKNVRAKKGIEKIRG
jgi:tetratricopeptide (TPR) repeat protein